MSVSNFQDHLSNQEGILQSTRGLHYVFQAIFLGIAAALIAIGYTVSSSISQSAELVKFELFTVSVLILCCFLVIIFGLIFLNSYSLNVYRRGLVIDYLQHLRVLHYAKKLNQYLSEVFVEFESDDILFILIKVTERCADNFGGIFREVRNVQKQINEKMDNKSYPYHEIIKFKRFDIYILSLFYCRIQDVDYVDFHIIDNPESCILWNIHKQRKISATRTGHKNVFLIVWAILVILLVLLAVFSLWKSQLLTWVPW